MTIQTITVGYGVKRSGSYQSAEASMSVEVQVGQRETPEAVFKAVMKQITPLVEREADLALRDLIAASEGGR